MDEELYKFDDTSSVTRDARDTFSHWRRLLYIVFCTDKVVLEAPSGKGAVADRRLRERAML